MQTNPTSYAHSKIFKILLTDSTMLTARSQFNCLVFIHFVLREFS